MNTVSQVNSFASDIYIDQLPTVETFHSVQGEGAWMGASAFFIRLAGCDVGCSWCDTKISWNVQRHPLVAIADLVQQVEAANPTIVIITGGEPLLHNLTPLTKQIRDKGFPVHLETSGSHPLTGQFDWITLSPKRFKPPHPQIYDQANELKVVVKDEADLLWAEANAAKVSPKVLKYLQAEWQTPSSQSLIMQYVLEHPEWRISVQTHKLLGIR
ncbi:MAG: 7-carboxy-7-deazaguanine synthase QueE [Pseudanabaenaceae cyanobacterium bins.39]|nr:7-carboxy-7-deazaguanine synthase QueE [Pseudanabaenaceae cyanobacterium bins.39]